MAFSLKSLPTYYNGASSFLSALVTFLTAVQGNEIITHEAPSNWVYGIGVAISALTGVLSHLKQAQPAVDKASEVANVLSDIENVLNSFRNPTPVTPTPATPTVPVAQKPIAIPINPPADVVSALESAVSEATSVAAQAGKSATDVVDEVTKVIQTYQLKLK